MGETNVQIPIQAGSIHGGNAHAIHNRGFLAKRGVFVCIIVRHGGIVVTPQGVFDGNSCIMIIMMMNINSFLPNNRPGQVQIERYQNKEPSTKRYPPPLDEVVHDVVRIPLLGENTWSGVLLFLIIVMMLSERSIGLFRSVQETGENH